MQQDSGIETLADLAGKNVVVQAASAALDALNSEDNKELTDSFAISHRESGLQYRIYEYRFRCSRCCCC